MNFTSDGAAWASPEVFERLTRERPLTTAIFDQDEVTKGLKARVEEIFEHEVDIFPVLTGSAANGLALSALAPAWGAIFSHWDAHIQTDECGAPEMFTNGAKLVGLPGEHGKIDPEALRVALEHARFGITHSVQPRVLSLTQATEAGTIYTIAEVLALSDLAKQAGLKVHMDGARFANAVAALGCSPADLSWRAGVDILGLGATKNGAFAAELIIVFDKSASEKLRYMRKRSGHFVAKTRLLSLQLEAYLTDDLWLRNARHANSMGQLLAAKLRDHRDISFVHPADSNQLFLTMPDALIRRLQAGGVSLFENWRVHPLRHHRMVASFATTEADIQAVGDLISGNP